MKTKTTRQEMGVKINLIIKNQPVKFKLKSKSYLYAIFSY